MNNSLWRRFVLPTLQRAPSEHKKNRSFSNPGPKPTNHRFYLQITLFLLVIGLLTSGLVWRLRGVRAAGTITGTVYLDYNMNGANDTAGTSPNLAIDSGVSGVVVTAYDSSGTQRGTATTAANGTYTLSATGTGPYRIEFTTLPSGYYPSTVGTNNASTVRFVADGNSSNIDLGLTLPNKYSENNPSLATNLYRFGPQDTLTTSVLTRFPYTSGCADADLNGVCDDGTLTYDAPTKVDLATGQQLGTTWGLAYHRANDTLYAGAFMKRHSGFRVFGDTGAIYAVSNARAGTPSITKYVDLDALGFDTGTDTHPSTPTSCGTPSSGLTCWEHDSNSWDGVGKMSLGDVDLSEDQTQLWTVNLFDKRLYRIAIKTTAVVAADITSFAVPTPADCPTPATNLRPFALAMRNGLVYAGLTCTGPATTDLRGYVYTLNPSNSTWTQVLNFPLNYNRGCAVHTAGQPITGCSAPADGDWRSWVSTFTTNATIFGNEVVYPQPLLTDIEFDRNDNMLLGVRDRYSDQTGFQVGSTDPTLNTLYSGDSSGDILRAGLSGSTWTLESNGSGTGGAGNTQGPGGGEFFYQENYPNHADVSLAGLASVPGFGTVAETAYDPQYDENQYYDGGIIWQNTANGERTQNYRVYNTDGGDTGTYAKAGGLGDLEYLTAPAPLQIGNRVWSDTDGDGIQDAGENGVQNVSVQLWADTNGDGVADTQVGTATTDSNGNYVFGGYNNTNLAVNTSCTSSLAVRVGGGSNDAEQTDTTATVAGAPLELGRTSGGADNTVGVRFTNLNVPKGASVTNATLTFTANATASTTVNVTVRGEANDNAAAFTTAASNLSSRTSTTASAAWSVGAWTASATTNAVSPNLSTIVNEVISRAGWAPNNSLVLLITNNGTTGTNRRAAQDAETLAATAPLLNLTYQCPYTVNPNTKYEVRLPASNFNAGGALNAIPQLSRQNADTTTNGDSRDSDGINSVVNGGGTSVLAPITTGGYGQNDHTVDLGFKAATVSLGNRVWNDLDNSGTLNGAETGLSGVVVQLYDSTGATLLATTTTDLSGYYSFTGLVSGTAYQVRLAASNFNTGGAFYGWASSTGTDGSTTGAYEGASTPDANPPAPITGGVPVTGTVDTDDNGTTTGTLGSNGYIGTRVNVTVTTNTNYTSETDGSGVGQTDASNNLTVDFGLWQPFSIGNRFWFDTNNNGARVATENGIGSVSLSLFLDANADGTPDNIATPIATLTTDSNGYYRFDNLKANSYVIRANASNFQTGGALVGYQSSGTTENSPNSDVDDNDNGRDAASLTNPQYNTNGVLSGTLTLAGTAEPTAEADALTAQLYAGQGTSDNKANLTVDFGFYKLSLSGTVWNDNGAGANRNNALLDAGETGRAGVVIRLYDSGGTEIGIGPDGILGTADDITGTITDATRVVTDTNGNYSFQGLPAGTYTVRFATPSGTTSSGDIASSANPNNNVNSDDNGQPGTGGTAGFIVSPAITLTPGSAGAAGNNSVSNTTGTTIDPTLDFGLVPLGPTAVKLAEFTAVSDGQRTLLQWRSGAEKDNLGYNVYRVGGNGVKVKVNPEILAGSLFQVGRTTLTAGNSYAWLDDNSGAGARYLLEDVDASGKRTQYGPIIAQPVAKLPTKAAPLARRLSQINEARANAASNPTYGANTANTANNNANAANSNTGEFVRPSVTGTTAARMPADSPAWQRQLWVAQQAMALRLDITQTGWYRVTGAQLQAAGLDLNSFAVSNLQLYADGVEVPLGLVNAYKVMTSESAVEFYGVTSDTIESGTRTYWLVAGDRAGLRLDNPRRAAPTGGIDPENNSSGNAGNNGSNAGSNNGTPSLGGMNTGGIMGTGGGMTGGGSNASALGSSSAASNAASYQQTVALGERALYIAVAKNGEETSNFYDAVVAGTPVTQTLVIDNLDSGSSTNATLSAELLGFNDGVTHRVQFSLNGNIIGEAQWVGFAPHTARFKFVNSGLQEGANTLTIKALGGSNDVSLTQRVRISYARRHVARGGQLWFATGKTPQNVSVTGFSNSQTRLFDVTNAAHPVLIPTRTAPDATGYALSAERLGAKRSFLAINEAAFLTPARLTRATPSHWTDAAQRADFLIIAPAAWREAVQPLAAARQARGLVTQVVSIEDIFAEWGGGERSVAALRGFLRWTAQNWATAPRYVLLVGDASYDPRDYLQLGAHDYVPTGWLTTDAFETMSDESLVDFNGDGVGEMSVGRWPVRSATEAAALTVKTLAYHADPSRGALFVSDTDTSEDFAGMNQALRSQLPQGMPSQTLVRGTQPDSTLRPALLAAMNNGPALVHYAGHGSIETWSEANLLASTDANQLTNNGRLSVYVMLTCLNGYFADEWSNSLAESLLKAPNGAVAVWASAGMTVPSSQQAAGTEWYRQTLTNGARLGDAARAAKRATTDSEVRATWVLFGDPTLVLR